MDNNIIIQFDNDRNKITQGESWTFTDSLNLAEVLNWQHYEVLRRIRSILKDYNLENEEHELKSESSIATENAEFIKRHTDFTYSIAYYKNSQNKLQPYYKMSKDLLVLVIFSFRKLENAQELQKAYIAEFNRMQKELEWWRARYLGIDVRNSLTDAVKEYIQNADWKDYMLFTDLVYKTLYGKTAKEIREDNGLKSKTNIRPLLIDSCLESVKKLEQEVMMFLSYGMDYHTIKGMLKNKHKGKQVSAELKQAS